MKYIDGFVAAVPTANRERYTSHAKAVAAVCKEHGALRVVECWGDDVHEGKLTSFPLAVKRGADETGDERTSHDQCASSAAPSFRVSAPMNSWRLPLGVNTTR